MISGGMPESSVNKNKIKTLGGMRSQGKTKLKWLQQVKECIHEHYNIKEQIVKNWKCQYASYHQWHYDEKIISTLVKVHSYNMIL
jgi:hypothetical protein